MPQVCLTTKEGRFMFRRFTLIAALALATSPAWAQQAAPAQPTANEVIDALSVKVSSVQQELDRMFLANAQLKSAAAAATAAYEARLATAMEWLKAAQTPGGKK